MRCSFVKELLPQYIGGLTSEDTSEDIKRHLAECEGCRAVYEYLLSAPTLEAAKNGKEETLAKKQNPALPKKKQRILFGVFTMLAVFILFARNYSIPIPFDAYHMLIETVPSTFASVNKDGEIALTDMDTLDFQNTKSVLSGNLEMLNLVHFTYRGINHVGSSSNARTISRNGKKVRVIYYRYSKTLWNLMFPSDLLAYSEGGSNYGEIYSDSAALTGGVHKPELREIYYLPMRNLGALDKLSDEKYDAFREKASLVWSGVN